MTLERAIIGAMNRHEILENRYRRDTEAIANGLIQLAVEDVRRHLKGPLQIKFGMGSEFIEYCGSQIELDGPVMRWGRGAPDWAYGEDGEYAEKDGVISHLRPLAVALQAAITIVDGYSIGCPDDISA